MVYLCMSVSDEFERLAHPPGDPAQIRDQTSDDGDDVAVQLMEQAVRYLLTTMDDLTGADLSRPTPCAEWDLAALLRHLLDSMDALQEGLTEHRVKLAAPAAGRNPVDVGGPAGTQDPVAEVRRSATRLLCAVTSAGGGPGELAVGDRLLTMSTLALVGAIEIAVHSWDVSWACGVHRPIPADLAADLLLTSPQVIPPANRLPLFAAPLATPSTATPAARLLAYLGRSPSPGRGVPPKMA
jgi:uncharacterized protein (TIGR03086 family)